MREILWIDLACNFIWRLDGGRRIRNSTYGNMVDEFQPIDETMWCLAFVSISTLAGFILCQFIGNDVPDFICILHIEQEGINGGEGDKLVAIWSWWEHMRSIISEVGLYD